MPDHTTRDPELEALPKPRRPWRSATLVSLVICGVLSALLAFGLMPQVRYALESGQPAKLGELAGFQPQAKHANRWVHGTGVLSRVAVGYRRPLERDRFRLAPLDGNEALWVEVREPEGLRGDSFLSPTSFVGRLVPLARPGIRHRGLVDSLSASGQAVPRADAWLLIDGEGPNEARWAFGVFGLLLAFALFSFWGIYRLLLPQPSRL